MAGAGQPRWPATRQACHETGLPRDRRRWPGAGCTFIVGGRQVVLVVFAQIQAFGSFIGSRLGSNAQ